MIMTERSPVARRPVIINDRIPDPQVLLKNAHQIPTKIPEITKILLEGGVVFIDTIGLDSNPKTIQNRIRNEIKKNMNHEIYGKPAITRLIHPMGNLVGFRVTMRR
jgi:hypothetical protein